MEGEGFPASNHITVKSLPKREVSGDFPASNHITIKFLTITKGSGGCPPIGFRHLLKQTIKTFIIV